MCRFIRSVELSASFAVCVLFAPGCGAEKVAAPKAYKTFASKDGSFTCKYPEGWEAEGGSGRGDFAWAKFRKGPVEIKVTADFAGSLVADIAKAGQSQSGSNRPEDQPVAVVHERKKKGMNDDFTNYREKAPRVANTGLGEARTSEFTASGSFGTKIRGYRATALTNDKSVMIVCQCPNTDWKRLRPA
ncbi:MAG TPA: hypothetical protein VGZ22_12155, partial [Isosphaeraceae bacterium]|jgi:hypothetical protein|nr:hypothetical protein [Isosphaeraceae bacterium]